jgi:hypothetical protein
MNDFDALMRRSVLALALMLALGIAACGDDDGGSAGADAGQADTASSEGSEALSGDAAADKKEITATMHSFKDSFNNMNGERYCAKLSTAGQQQVVAGLRKSWYAKAIKARDCAGIVDAYTKELVGRQNNGYRPVEVRRISLDGDKARVVVKGGLAGRRSVVPFNMVREDGEWKVADPVTAAQNVIRVEKFD